MGPHNPSCPSWGSGSSSCVRLWAWPPTLPLGYTCLSWDPQPPAARCFSLDTISPRSHLETLRGSNVLPETKAPSLF